MSPKTKTTPKKTVTKKKKEKTIKPTEKKIKSTEKQTKVKKETIKKVKKEKTSPEKKKELFSPKIGKITINIGVGESGERLKKAETVLKNLTGRKPIETLSKTTNKDWNLRKRMPIGCKVTLRGNKAVDFLKEALFTRENKISDYSFDEQGNVSFGIPDHTLFKTQKYDPNIGIFGMDINITMEKPGFRVKKRRIARAKIPNRHKVDREETMKFFSEKLNAEVVK